LKTLGASGPWTDQTRIEPGKEKKPEPAIRLEVRKDTVPPGLVDCQKRKKVLQSLVIAIRCRNTAVLLEEDQ
jgi:hypothetical protein